MKTEFTKGDKQSQGFLKMMKHLEGRLQELRIDNDKNLTESQTNNTRGRIQEVKSLLALAKDEPKLEE